MSWLTFFGKNLNSKIYVFLCIRNIEDWIIWPSEQIREKMSMSWMTWPKGQNLKVKNLSVLCIRNIENWITWPSEQIREKIFTLTSQNPFFPSKLQLRKLNFHISDEMSRLDSRHASTYNLIKFYLKCYVFYHLQLRNGW